jgi:hypothetical protein
MKFDEAFKLALEKEIERNAKFAVTSKTARMFAFFWNMLVAADGQLDDYVLIDNNNNIISTTKKSVSKKTEKKLETDVKEEKE